MDANNIEKCKYCPVQCGLCIAQKSGHVKFCDRIDPSKPGYNVKYREAIEHMSCGTIYNKAVEATITVEPVNSGNPTVTPEYPSLLQQGKNLLNSTAKFVKGGMKLATEEEMDRRKNICKSCPFFDADQGRCKECGCYIAAKSRMQTETCPHNYWAEPEQLIKMNKAKEIMREEMKGYTHSVITHPCQDCK